MISSCGHPEETFLALPLHTGPYWDTLGQVSGHCRKTWHQMGSAGFGFVWLAKEGEKERGRGGWGKTEWGSRSQLEGRKRELHRREAGLGETKTTPAYHKRASRRKARLLSEANKTREGERKKQRGGICKSLPFTCKGRQHRYSPPSSRQVWDSSFQSPSLWLRASSRALNRWDGGESSFKTTSFFRCAAFFSLFCFCGFTPITWMTSASRQTRRDYISMTHFLKYAGLLLQW